MGVESLAYMVVAVMIGSLEGDEQIARHEGAAIDGTAVRAPIAVQFTAGRLSSLRRAPEGRRYFRRICHDDIRDGARD